MPSLLCPLCRQPLAPVTTAAAWRCAAGHSYDVAREGYVNLLPVQHKQSLDPGNSAEMVRARRAFLAAGHYAPLREAVRARAQALAPVTLLDIGCGEGYYTAALATAATAVVALDIARPAVRLAARQHRAQARITWLVASGARLPVPDGAADLACCLFIPLHPQELRRAVRPGGHVLLATPGPEHLWTLREGLFDTVRAHEPEKFVATFAAAGFARVSQAEVRVPLALDAPALRDLLAMTPYVWKARPERRAALEARAGLATEAVFSVMVFGRER